MNGKSSEKASLLSNDPIGSTEHGGELTSINHNEPNSYGAVNLTRSWSSNYGPTPRSADKKAKRGPFHIRPSVSANDLLDDNLSDSSQMNDDIESTHSSSVPIHESILSRYRYYSRLGEEIPETALNITDVTEDLFSVPHQGKQSSSITILSIWNTMMGTGLLTMPWAFGTAGFVGGIFIMLGMGMICLFTAYTILTLQSLKGLGGPLREASQLVRELIGGKLGRILEGVAIIFSIVTLLGTLMVYWVLMSNFLFNTGELIHDELMASTPFLKNSSGNTSSLTELTCAKNISMPLVYHNFLVTILHQSSSRGNMTEYTDELFSKLWSQCGTVPLYLLIIFVPLLSIKNTKIFSYFNSLGAIAVCVIYGFVIHTSYTWGININFTDPNNDLYAPLFKSQFMALSGTLSLAYFIHNCIITLLKNNRNQEKNVRDLSIAFTMVAGTYIPIGMIFYICFPLPKNCIADNLLDNFPPHDIALGVVRIFLLFQMITVFPLLAVFLRTQLFTYLKGSAEAPFWMNALVNSIILTCAVSIAIFYPKIGFLIRWIGALSGLVYVFLLPCGLHLKVRYEKNSLTIPAVLLHGSIMLFGVMNFFSQFFV